MKMRLFYTCIYTLLPHGRLREVLKKYGRLSD